MKDLLPMNAKWPLFDDFWSLKVTNTIYIHKYPQINNSFKSTKQKKIEVFVAPPETTIAPSQHNHKRASK